MRAGVALFSMALVVAALGVAGCGPTREELALRAAYDARQAEQNERVGESFVRGHQARGRPPLPYGGSPSKPSSMSGTTTCSSNYVGSSAADALLTAAFALLGVCAH